MPGFRLGFCILFRALVRNGKRAAAISAKSEKGGGEVQSILLTREYPKMEPREGVESEIQRLVLDVISKNGKLNVNLRELKGVARRCRFGVENRNKRF